MAGVQYEDGQRGYKTGLEGCTEFQEGYARCTGERIWAKAQSRNDTKKVASTPRAAGKGAEDVFGMYVEPSDARCCLYADWYRLDGLVPNTPRPGALAGVGGVNGSTVKRKSNFETPASKASKSHEMSSPGGILTLKGEANGGPCVISSLIILLHLTLSQYLRFRLSPKCGGDLRTAERAYRPARPSRRASS